MAERFPKKLALDTNVLFDLADAKEFAVEFREVFRARGFELLAPPTVLAELHYFRRQGDREQRRLAELSVRNLLGWRVVPLVLGDLEVAIAKRFAELVRLHRLVPAEESNDARILAEATVARISLLVTSDHHLLDIDADALQATADEADLPAIDVASPKRLLRVFR